MPLLGLPAPPQRPSPQRGAQIPLQQQFLQQLSVGVNVTLSGPYGRYGAEVVKGVQSAVDEINKFNAPVSHVYGVRAFDDKNQAIVASTNASVAASDPSVIGIVGNLTAEMTLASLPHYANVGFAVFVPTVTADPVTRRGFHNVFRLPANDSDSGRLFASAALYGKRPVASLAVALDGSYGFDVARAFVQQAKSDHHPADVLLFPERFTDRSGRRGADDSRPRARLRVPSAEKPQNSDRSPKRCARTTIPAISARATAFTTRTR